jgi:hypothetical protein
MLFIFILIFFRELFSLLVLYTLMLSVFILFSAGKTLIHLLSFFSISLLLALTIERSVFLYSDNIMCQFFYVQIKLLLI